MSMRRINYLLVWLGCLLFFWAYRQWISWLVLIAVTVLPLFSLLISLPAMIAAGIHFNLPTFTSIGMPCTFQPDCKTVGPAPAWKCKAELTNMLTGHHQQIEAGALLPTDHCGLLKIQITEAYVYDYLGLFRCRIPAPGEISLTVRPQPIAPESNPKLLDVADRLVDIGDTPDHSAPRPYQPGDSARQIHWKLSQKTGSLIVNETESLSPPIRLQINLEGTQSHIDETLGVFLWLGQMLTNQNIKFEVACVSANGSERWHIRTNEDLLRTLDAVLCRRCCRSLSNSAANEDNLQQQKSGGG
jgi:hypothetical protein